MDVAFRMAQWRITSGVQCTFVAANHSLVSLRLKFNKVSTDCAIAGKTFSCQFCMHHDNGHRHGLNIFFGQAAKVQSSQFLFLNVPSVSWFEWHPLSVAAVIPGADNLSQDVILHLKAYGHWSKVKTLLIFQHGRACCLYIYLWLPSLFCLKTISMASLISPLLRCSRQNKTYLLNASDWRVSDCGTICRVSLRA